MSRFCKWSIRVALLALLFAAPALAQTGPGGVGTTDGASALKFWLKADVGVTESSGAVSDWADQSGNAAHVTQSNGSLQPTFVSADSGGINGLPVVHFDNERRLIGSNGSLFDFGTGDFSWFFVALTRDNTTAFNQVFGTQQNGGTNSGFTAGFDANEYPYGMYRATADIYVKHAVSALNEFVIFGSVRSSGSVDLFRNGNAVATGSASVSILGNPIAIGAQHTSGTEFLNGDVAEIVIFSGAMNVAQRIVLQNYFSAKYGIALTVNDLYAGDDPGNGNYDFDVIGIGRTGGDSHETSQRGGLYLNSNGAVNADGDWLFAGHNGVTTALVQTDLVPSVSDRWSRIWYFDKTGTLDGVQIGFDFSDSGIGGTPSSQQAYVLLYRSGTSGDFSVVATTGFSITSDQVIFDVQDANLNDGYYTLGIENRPPVGNFGYALNFNGTSSYVEVPDSTSLDLTNSLTLEAWIYMPSLPSSENTIVSKGRNSTGIGYFLSVNMGGAIDFGLNNGTNVGVQLPAGTLEANRWTHLAGTYDGAVMILYVDGKEVGRTATNIMLNNSSEPLFIGRMATGLHWPFEGLIDEVRVWALARTPGEILRMKDTVLSGFDAGLVGYWRLDDGAGTLASDRSPEGNDGTVFNADWVTADHGAKIVVDGSGGYSHYLSGADIDGDDLTFSIVTNGTKGTAAVTNASTGAFTYTPTMATSDADSFVYRVSDDTFDAEETVYVKLVPAVFTDVTSAPLNHQANGRGVAWGDLTGNGFLDLFVANVIGGANKLFRNDDGSSFTDITTFAGVGDTGESHGVALGDYNNDGDLDIYVANNGQANLLYRNIGNETFTDVGNAVGVDDGGGGYGVSWVDYDLDGHLDLYIARYGAANILYRNSGNGTSFTNESANVIIDDNGNSKGHAWGDFTNSGYPDLYIANDGANKLFRNDGNGVFTEVTTSPGNLGGDDSQGAVWFDYDNDGHLDLFVINEGTADKLFRNDGNGGFQDVGGGAGVEDTGSGHEVGWADFDNDGRIDLYVGRIGGSNLLYWNRGDGTFAEIAGLAGVNYSSGTGGVSWGDYDNDGFLDLYVVNVGNTAPNRLYRNQGNANRYLQVELAGTLSNRSGIGAVVRTYVGNQVQRRDVDGGSGTFSQASLPVEFGFGSTMTVDSLIVDWPSGSRNVLIGESTNQLQQQPFPQPLNVEENHPPIAAGFGGALAFDGNDYLEVADDESLRPSTEITLEAWFKYDTIPQDWAVILAKEGANGNDYVLGISADQKIHGRFQTNASWRAFDGMKSMNLNEWHHVAVIYDGEDLKVYLDGELDFQEAWNEPLSLTGTNVMHIGRRPDGVLPFSGEIGEIRIWDVARTQSDVHDNMHLSANVEAMGLGANWPFIEGRGTVAADASANDNDATFGTSPAAPLWTAMREKTTPYGVALEGQLRAGDGDDDMLVFTLLTDGAKGSAEIMSYGHFTYTPNNGQSGWDSFVFEVSDGQAADVNTVHVMISAPPVQETVPASGLSGSMAIGTPGADIPIFKIGLTGNGTDSLQSVTLTISDLTGETGLLASDFVQLKLFRSSDNVLGAGDVQVGTQSVVNIGSPTTITVAEAEEIPETETFYIVAASLNPDVLPGKAFKVGFALGDVATSFEGVGTAFGASDDDRINISNVRETTFATGVPGPMTAEQGDEVRIFSIGLTGDGGGTLSSIGLAIQALEDETGLEVSDFVQVNLYRSADALLDDADVLIGSQSSVVIEGVTTVAPTSHEPVPATETFYIATAVLAEDAVPGHAFRVGFAAGGVQSPTGAKGTAVVAQDENSVTIAASNIAPVATSQTVEGLEDEDVVIALTGTDADGDSLTAIITTLPAKGALYQTGDGITRDVLIVEVPTQVTDAARRVIYAPPADSSGSPLASFAFKVNDGTVDSETVATVSINITPVNDAPTLAKIDGITILEDAEIQIVTLSGISAGGGEVQALTVTATSDNVSLIPHPDVDYTSPSANGTLTFTPEQDLSGVAVITVTVTDDGGTDHGGVDTFVRTFTVTVTPVKDPPVISVSESGLFAIAEGEMLTFEVSATDVDSEELEITHTELPEGAVFEGWVFTWTPSFDQSGEYEVTFTVSDGELTDEITVHISVEDVNRAPMISASESGPFAISEGELLTFTVSATDEDGDELTITHTELPEGAVFEDGIFTWPPDYGQSGEYAVTFSVSDGALEDEVTVSILVEMSNRAPVATSQTVTGLEDEDVVVALTGTDADGDSLTAFITSLPLKGTLYQTGDGITRSTQIVEVPTQVTDAARRVIFAPPADSSGSPLASFAFKVNDGTVDSETAATVSVNITPVNDAPTLAAIPEMTILEDAPVQTVSLSGISVGGGEVQVLTVTALSSRPSLIPNPVVNYTSPNATGTLTFTPVADSSGVATITVTVKDDGGTANGGVDTFVRTFTVTVTSVNDAPTLAVIDPVAILEDTPAQTVALSGISAGGGEVQVLTVTATSSRPSLIPNPVVNYTSPNATGTLTFTPVADSSGVATITVTVKDDGGTANGGVDTFVRTFTVTVTPVEDPPIAVDDVYEILEDTPTVMNVRSNDRDPDGDPIAIISVSNVRGGTAQITPDSMVLFTPTLNYFGPGGFSYTISDNKGNTASASVSITILPVNDPPVANPDVATTQQGQAVTISVLANDTDVENDPLSLVGVSAPANGTATVSGSSVVYTPNPEFSGIETFTYDVSDGQATSTGTVTVTVIRRNSPPVVVDHQVVLASGVLSANVDVKAGAVDADGDALVLAELGTPTNGTVVINSDGTVFYRRNQGFNGQDSFTFTISDGHGGTAKGKVLIEAQAPPGAPVAVSDAAETRQAQAVVINVLANDLDGGAPGLRVTGASGTSNAMLTIGEGGAITYTPNPGFRGEDRFTYTVANGADLTATATVTVTVIGVNQPPQIRAFGEHRTLENKVYELDLTPYASDPDNPIAELRWEVLGVAEPVISAQIDGMALRAVPGVEKHGTGSVKLALIDKDGARAEGELFIFFEQVDDPPVFDPTVFHPADGATNVPRSVIVGWKATDPDTPVLKYSVRLGRVSNVLNTAVRDLTVPTYAFRAEFGQTWFYQVVVTDGKTEVVGPVLSFTVEADRRPPAISRVDVVDVTETGARVIWTTDKIGTSLVRFGRAADLSDAAEAFGTDGVDHSVILPTLVPDAVYHYQVVTTDQVGNVGRSEIRTFATLRARDVTPPSFVAGPFVEGVDDKSAGVRFEVNELATAVVTVTGGEGQTLAISTPGLSLFGRIEGLSPSTNYEVVVAATDAAGNTATSGAVAFRTVATPDVTPPVFERRPDVAAKHIAATIGFGVNEPSTAVVKYGLSLDALSLDALTLEATAPAGVDFAMTLPDLDPNTPYVYELTIADLAGNKLIASGSFRTLRAPDTTPPVILQGPSVQGVTQDQATISWKTDEPAFSRVVFDTLSLSDRSFRTALTGAASLDHTHRLSGLIPGKTYSYQVVSTDAAGNTSTSGADVFTTRMAPDTTPPVLTSNPVASGIGSDRLTVEWKTDEASTSEVTAEPVVSPGEAQTTPPAQEPRAVSRTLSVPVQNHSVALTGLVGGTVYRISIRSVDAAQNAMQRANVLTVTTLKAPDTTPPKIIGLPEVQQVTDMQARIAWRTDEPADRFVEVDTLSDFSTSQRFGATAPSLTHVVTATNLVGGKTYFYRVFSTDVLGNGPTQYPLNAPLSFRTARTPDTTPPVMLEGPVAVSVSEHSATIVWALNEPGDAVVLYATSEAELATGAQRVFNPSLSSQHAMALTGLEAGTRYVYRVQSTDAAKNGPTQSGIRSFTTLRAPDTTPPKILAGPSVTERTENRALVEWETDEPATTEVEYNGVRISRSEGAMHHRVQLTNLEPETEYRYKIISTDAAGNTTEREGQPFRTPGKPDLEPPNILEGPGIDYVSDRQVMISWTTDEAATSKVVLWPEDDPNNELPPVYDSRFKRNHRIAVPQLDKGKRYAYRVESSDPSGNTVVAGQVGRFKPAPGVVTKIAQPPGGGGSFFTNLQPDTQFPVILKGPHVVSSTATALTVEWATDETSNSGVSFGVDGLALRVEDGAHVLTHRVVLTNLEPNTTYQYQVESTDPAGNGATRSRVFLAKTAAAVDTLPPRITLAPRVIYSTERQATIAWETDKGAQTVLEFGTEALNAQRAVPDFVTQHQVSLTNLTASTTYRYRVLATDAAGNGPVQSAILTFTTDAEPDRTPPVITRTPTAEVVTDVSALIRWQTDKLANNAVRYAEGEHVSPGALGLVAGSLISVTAHEVALTHLKPGTTYSFLVQNTDRSGNGPTSSQVVTFTTLLEKDETPPPVPEGLSVRGALGQLVVTWTPVEDSDLAGYDILRAVGAGDFAPVATLVPQAQYVDDGLDGSLVYRYRVRAIDLAGNQSDVSAIAEGRADGAGLPTAPVAKGVEGDDLRPTLRIENATSTVPLIYNFQIAKDEAFAQVVASVSGVPAGEETTAWTVDVALEDGATYYWRARAFDGVFDGPFMPTAQFVAGAAAQPVVYPGDFDGDLQVGFSDFLAFVGAFGSRAGDPAYREILDLNKNGVIDFPDFLVFASLFGTRYSR